jgi:hypothetical protein
MAGLTVLMVFWYFLSRGNPGVQSNDVMTETFREPFLDIPFLGKIFPGPVPGRPFSHLPQKEHAYMAGNTMQAGNYDHSEVMYAF